MNKTTGLWVGFLFAFWFGSQTQAQPSLGPDDAPSQLSFDEYKSDFGNLQYLGEATFPTGFIFENVELGGLSGITYDAENDLYYCVSDDRGKFAPARYYTMKIDFSEGSLNNSAVDFIKITTIQDKNGKPFRENSIDPEGIVLTARKTLFISSEGDGEHGFEPFIRQFNLDGSFSKSLRLPKKFLPTPNAAAGVRDNLAFESLTITPEQTHLFSATENALIQDGPASDLGQSSPSRILKYDLPSGNLNAEFLYWVDPVEHQPVPADGFRVNGLVELIALDEQTLLSLERSYVTGVGNGSKLYLVSLVNADDIQKIASLKKVDIKKIRAAQKTLLYNLADLHILLDNIEGMTLGPKLSDGRQSLILISDNNFNSKGQFTQILAFAIGDKDSLQTSGIRINAIQGAGQISPFANKAVSNVHGVVTAVQKSGREPGFWMQDPYPDADEATSEGIFVAVRDSFPDVKIGDAVLVDGRVEEHGFPGQLTVTRLVDADIAMQSRGHALPAPIVIGSGGRMPPTEIIENDSLKIFDPAQDGIDFYESLEGMRVQIKDAMVVGPTSPYGEIVVLADNGSHASVRSQRGGIVVRPDDFNPERIFIADLLTPNAPEAVVGDRFAGLITGVMDYSFANFKLLNPEPLPEVVRGGLSKETTNLTAQKDALTVATYNVENLDFKDSDEKFASVAKSIVENLQSPDIIALQEMQDNDGPVNQGIVDASETFARLVQTIASSGGPHYEFRQINPLNNADGGEPGGNIRVGFLFNPQRVKFIDHGQAGPLDATQVRIANAGPELTLSPGRIAPENPAFVEDESKDYEPSRKSLAGEFEFNGQRLFVITNHLKSKRGDDRLFGANQPPQFKSEIQRRAQAQVILDFVKVLLSKVPAANIIVLGDMNEHEFRSPIRTLVDNSLTDLIEHIPLDDRYTYIFNGNSQVLDHILVSSNLLKDGLPEIDIVHINAEYPDPQRASDHEPVVARFKLSYQK